jgi:hypothetical protein
LDSSEFSDVFLANSKPKKIFPENGFIFYIHHGYQFEFFLCEGQEDPPVYFFSDNPELVDFKQINSRLSAEIISFVDEFINIHRKNITAKPKLQKNLNLFKKKLLDIIDMVDNRKKVYLNDKNTELLHTSYRQVSTSIYTLYTQPEIRSQIYTKLQNYVLISANNHQNDNNFEKLVSRAKELEYFFKEKVEPFLD